MSLAAYWPEGLAEPPPPEQDQPTLFDACESCNGHGRLYGEPCADCQGTAYFFRGAGA